MNVSIDSIPRSQSRRNQLLPARSQTRGFVLPMVIFLIVVLAGAAVAISQLTTDNTQSNIQALQKTRADLFNQSLIDVAVHKLVTGDDDCPDITDQSHLDFTALSVTLNCRPAEYSTSGSGDFTLWTITSTANSSGGLSPSDEEYVWRRMSAVVEPENE